MKSLRAEGSGERRAKRSPSWRVAVAVLGMALLVPLGARAQGDGPRNLPIIPIGTNIFAPAAIYLTGNFNPQQTVFVPGAEVDVFAVPLTYIRSFGLGGRFARLFVTAPLATLEASAEIFDPVAGRIRVPERERKGIMDPLVTMHIGLIGAPALTLPEFMKHPKSFQMVAIVGTSIPIGTYDSDRLINLGTNRWMGRGGIGTVTPLGKATQWESANSFFFFTENDDLRLADSRSQAPLFASENHINHNFTPKFWGGVDLRWQYGGETTTNDVDDDNRTNILGGGLSAGYQFTPHLGGYGTIGKILAGDGDAKETMFRWQLAYSF